MMWCIQTVKRRRRSLYSLKSLRFLSTVLSTGGGRNLPSLKTYVIQRPDRIRNRFGVGIVRIRTPRINPGLEICNLFEVERGQRRIIRPAEGIELAIS
jgi:hypothetical protein